MRLKNGLFCVSTEIKKTKCRAQKVDWKCQKKQLERYGFVFHFFLKKKHIFFLKNSKSIISKQVFACITHVFCLHYACFLLALHMFFACITHVFCLRCGFFFRLRAAKFRISESKPNFSSNSFCFAYFFFENRFFEKKKWLKKQKNPKKK